MKKVELAGFKKWLDERYGQPGIAFYVFLGCLVVIGFVGTAAMIWHQPLLFPSLGPVIILFFERGNRPAGWPRNVFIAHGIAIIAGWCSLAVFGLLDDPNILANSVTTARVGAAMLALGSTAFFKHLFRAPHPPSGATTLIISLGFLTTLFDMAMMAVSVVLVTILGWALNHLSGGHMPIWGKGARTS